MNNETFSSEIGLEKKAESGLSEYELEKSRRELVKEYKIGERGVAASIDALHATPPSNDEIRQVVIRENEDIDNIETIVEDIIQDVDRQASAIREENPELSHKQVLSRVLQALGDDALYHRIIHLMKLYEQGTDEIARIASETAGSSFVVACSRIKEDWNRPEDANEISNKAGKPLEKSSRAHIVEKELYTEFMRDQYLLDENGALKQPYIHISVHGCAKLQGGSDIFIANGIKDGGRLPCDPEIARWFKEQLEKEITSRNLLNSRGEPLKVQVATEGQRLSGSTANVRRRWGAGGAAQGWGSLFQYIQLEIGPYSRSFYRQEFGEIVGGIIKDFNTSFPSSDELNNYLSTNETSTDAIRKEGSIVVNRPFFSERVETGTIGANSDCRNALAAESGDEVDVSILNSQGEIQETTRMRLVKSHYTFKKHYITLPPSMREVVASGVVVKRSGKEAHEAQ